MFEVWFCYGGKFYWLDSFCSRVDAETVADLWNRQRPNTPYIVTGAHGDPFV